MIPDELRVAVEKMNKIAEGQLEQDLTPEQELLIRSYSGMLQHVGKGKTGQWVYAIRDQEEVQSKRKSVIDAQEQLRMYENMLKDSLTADIRSHEHRLEPYQEEYQACLQRVTELEELMKRSKTAIVGKLVELRMMGFTGITSIYAKVPSLGEIEQRYGVRVKGWEEFLKMYNNGDFERIESAIQAKADEILKGNEEAVKLNKKQVTLAANKAMAEAEKKEPTPTIVAHAQDNTGMGSKVSNMTVESEKSV